MKRALAAASVVAAAGVVPVMAAAPAQATQAQCKSYLAGKGYIVGPRVSAACSHRAIGSAGIYTPNPYCVVGLLEIGVRSADATAACRRA